MTPQDYNTRIKRLGFTTDDAWCAFVGIHRQTHYRHKTGETGIPPIFVKVVEWLEAGHIPNPNKPE